MLAELKKMIAKAGNPELTELFEKWDTKRSAALRNELWVDMAFTGAVFTDNELDRAHAILNFLT